MNAQNLSQWRQLVWSFLTVPTGWFMSDLMIACMEAACQFQKGPRLGEDPSRRCYDHVPVYKPGELLYVAAMGMKRNLDA